MILIAIIFKNAGRVKYPVILMTTTIMDIMRKKLETIEGTASVQQASKKMKDRNVSSLVVVDEKGNPQGIVSERDLVKGMLQ